MLWLSQRSNLFHLKFDFRTVCTSFSIRSDGISNIYLPKIVSACKSVSWVVMKERVAAGTVHCGFAVWPLPLLELTDSLGFREQPVYSIPKRAKSSQASNVSNVLGLVFCFYSKFLIIILHVTMQYPFSQLGEVSEGSQLHLLFANCLADSQVLWKQKALSPNECFCGWGSQGLMWYYS